MPQPVWAYVYRVVLSLPDYKPSRPFSKFSPRQITFAPSVYQLKPHTPQRLKNIETVSVSAKHFAIV